MTNISLFFSTGTYRANYTMCYQTGLPLLLLFCITSTYDKY